MSLIHINSERFNTSNYNIQVPSFIDNVDSNINPFFRAKFDINPLSVTRKKLYLKEFGFNYCILTLNKSFNTHLQYYNITDNLYVNYTFDPQNFDTQADFVTYLNATCTDLNFVHNTNTLDGNKYGRITINHIDPTKSFRIIFDEKSIFRLLGFYFGTTQNVPAGSTITGVYNFTLQPIGTIYINIGLPSVNLSNLGISFTYVAVVGATINEFSQKIRIFEFESFSQYIDISSTQFNQMIISFEDAFGNFVPLNSIYTLTFELLD